MYVAEVAECLGSLEVDVAVADLYGVDLDGVGGVRDALTGGQVVDLLVEGEVMVGLPFFSPTMPRARTSAWLCGSR